MDPTYHIRGTDGFWYELDPNTNTMYNTGRPHEGVQGNQYERLDPTNGKIIRPYTSGGSYYKSRRNSHKRVRRNSKKQKRVHHTRRKQIHRHRHSRNRR